MEAFSLPVVCRSIGSGTLMLNTMGCTPFSHGFGNKLSVISDDDLNLMVSLVFDSTMPTVQDISGFRFVFKKEAPDITRVIIDNIHGV